MNAAHIIVTAERDGEVFRGSVDEVAAHVGRRPERVREAVKRGTMLSNGWKVRQDGQFGYVYTATKPGEDNIVGPAEEVACLLGLSIYTVWKMALHGRRVDGWSVTKELREY